MSDAANWCVEECEYLYRLFFSALLANEEGGYEQEAEFTRRQIKKLMQLGKISDQRAAQLRIAVRKQHQIITAQLQESTWGKLLGVTLSDSRRS